MRKLFTFGLVFLTWFGAGGQNLVPNPSFEQFTMCPLTYGELDKAIPWNRPSAGSTDYFHSCSGPGSPVNVPDHYAGGHQYARTGEGYVGLTTYKSTYVDYREYLQAPLNQSLQASACYLAEFWTNKKNTARYSSDNLGIHFHKGPKTSLNSTYLDLPVHVSSPMGYCLEDTLDWTLISGYYVAQGGEDHILIGNFKGDFQTTTNVHMPASNELYAFYYIEDVSLTPVDDSIDLGPDTLLCAGQTLSLDIRLPGATYAWSDGNTQGLRVISSPGRYSVEVFIGQCQPLRDSILVSYIPAPEVDLGQDTSLCIGRQHTLDAGVPFGSYLWQDGSTEPTCLVSSAGAYSVRAENQCGVDQDTLMVDFMVCEGLLFAPNAFSPNGDGINDRFMLRGAGIEKMELLIYDRLGGMVFRSTDIDASWDGTASGRQLPAGMYAWMATFTGGGTTLLEKEGRKQGMVVLLR